MKKRIVALLLLTCMLFAFSGEAFAATVRVKSLKITNGNVCVPVGKSITLKTTVTPSNATKKGVTWSTSDKKIATVSSKGVVKGLKTGTVTITATSKDNKKIKATCKITVGPVPVSGLKITNGNVTVKRGDSVTLKATVTPSNATNKGVTWSSSNPLAATVNSSGVVKVKGYVTYKDKVTITATSKDNDKIKASCTITVVDGFDYKVVKVKDLPTKWGKVYEVWGEPGDTLTVSKSISHARTFSVKAGVSIKEIGLELGWGADETDTINVTTNNTWKVPTKYNNKKVKKASMDVEVKMDRVEYKIQRRGYVRSKDLYGLLFKRYIGKWEDWKTGCIAERARNDGMTFHHRWQYK